jgi:aromatic-L-amino-acid/L-tryptophan decarboxylase
VLLVALRGFKSLSEERESNQTSTNTPFTSSTSLMNFDFDSATRRKLGYQLIDAIDDFYSSLPERPVQLPADQRTYGPLTRPMPEDGEDPARVLDETLQAMIGQGFHVGAASYFGLMNPTPTYMGFIGEALAAGLNPQLATLARSQLASKIELETVQWIGSRIGWSESFNGTFTSGGNEANFSALALALAAKFPGAIEDGVATVGAPALIYASEEAHHSLDKSAGLLGLGRKALRRVPINNTLQMDVSELEKLIDGDLAAGKKPFCVVATAGTTTSGVVDGLPLIADVCKKYALWLHVDGAYGASVVFSDRYRDRLRGIEQADSVTIDPHKWLAVPFAAGVILTRHAEILEQAFAVYAPYMPKAKGAVLPDNSRISTQWTRRMNSLKLWLSLRVHGRKGYEDLIARQFALAEEFSNWVRASDVYELVVEPMLPIVNFRLREKGSAELAESHARIVDRVTQDGRRWISDSLVGGKSVLRMMVISYLTERRHIRNLEESLMNAATS